MKENAENVEFPILYPLVILYFIRFRQVDDILHSIKETDITVNSDGDIILNDNHRILKSDKYYYISMDLFANSQIRKQKFENLFLFDGEFLGIKNIEKRTLDPARSIEFILTLMVHIGLDKLYIDDEEEKEKKSCKKNYMRPDLRLLEGLNDVQRLTEILQRTINKLYFAIFTKEDVEDNEDCIKKTKFHEYIQGCFKAFKLYDYNYQVYENLTNLQYVETDLTNKDLQSTPESFLNNIYLKKIKLLNLMVKKLYFVSEKNCDRDTLFAHTVKIDKVLKEFCEKKGEKNTINKRSALNTIRKRFVNQMFLIEELLEDIEVDTEKKLSLIQKLTQIYINIEKKDVLSYYKLASKDGNRTLYEIIGIKKTVKKVRSYNSVEQAPFNLNETIDNTSINFKETLRVHFFDIDTSEYYLYLDDMDMSGITLKHFMYLFDYKIISEDAN